jgi:hypothetical protein
MNEFREPIDFNEVIRDDESLTSLAEGGYGNGEALFVDLARWRAEVVMGIPELVGTDEALVVIRGARRWRRWDRFTDGFFWSLFVIVFLVALTIAIGI